ncbi:MAG: hypothetical protein J1F14_04435 [Treponema sp.]|nr:hypothetical protein [Treponema sp.]
MDSQDDISIEDFLLARRDAFSMRDMARFLFVSGIRASQDEIREFLYDHPLVLPLGDDMYITRPAAFTGRAFSIRPTAQEVAQGMFVPGDRCMPFVDSEQVSSSLQFYADGSRLGNKSGTFDSDLAIDMFLLYGEEYAPQYIAADPANSNLDLVSRDFELPASVRLTGVDLDLLSRRHGFRLGDRLLCRVSDWSAGRVDVTVLHADGNQFDQGETGERRLAWYGRLEKLLLDSFDAMGPQDSIEMQLARVFAMHLDELCSESCGSVEEFMCRYSRRVGLGYFGVETRLWLKGKDIPFVGSWSIKEKNFLTDLRGGMGEDAVINIPEFILDQYVLDMLFSRSDDLTALVSRIVPGEHDPAGSLGRELMLHLQGRRGILERDYNWFADQTVGKVRHKTLLLYGKVLRLMSSIDCDGKKLEQFPQQELVILSQLHNHLVRMIQSVAEDDGIEEDFDALMLSVEGMDWNFEDIKDALEAAVERQRINRFKVVRIIPGREDMKNGRRS